ncbi:hypothetical protein [Pseudoxanthomonas wuyuanensis]|nr:hypothetical protein [Pseudoxanthomonas wuyuanensis]
MLPDDFHWHLDDRYGHHWLRRNRHEVALINRVSEGRWLMTVNRQRSDAKGHGYAATLAHAKRMVERWAAVNAERLRLEVLDDRLGAPPAIEPTLSREDLRAGRKAQH